MATKLQKGLQISDKEMRTKCAETYVIDADKKKRKVLE